MVPPVSYEESMKIKAWTGYEKEAFGDKKEETVYITETGVVYHKDYHCTYLELSIRMVQASKTASLRNNSGGKTGIGSLISYLTKSFPIPVTGDI